MSTNENGPRLKIADFGESLVSGSETKPKLDFNGIGVSPELISFWKSAYDRFDLIGSQRIDFYTIPHNDRAIQFLRGESEYDIRDNKPNLVNNPLGLIRPTTLHTVNSFYYENNHTDQGPNYYARNYAERKHNDAEKESKYIESIKAFESLAVTVCASLNENDQLKREGAVKKALGEAFGEVRESQYIPPTDVRKASPIDSPQGWLIYSVLSILDNPSDKITPIGRLRALELLQLYPASELSEAFRSEKYKNQFHNGYDRIHKPRLPYSFCTREERLSESHNELWKKNYKIQNIIVRDGNKKIDTRASTVALIEKAPEEAIQIALLLLHSYDTSEFAISFLRSLTQLGPEVKSKMFGQKATFLIEHKLPVGTDVNVEMAAGIKEAPNSNLADEMTERTREEMLQMLRRKNLQIEGLEELLVAAESRGAKAEWEILRLKSIMSGMEGELKYWRKGEEPANERRTSGEDIFDKLDPKGYYRALGLHPQTFIGLNDTQTEELLNRHKKIMSPVLHPDRGGDLKKMQEFNVAFDFMVDPNKRRNYGK